MNRTIFVISDLHLGGKPGFQICSPQGQRLLADFIRWTASYRTEERDVNLVLAGDIVDFLAEEPFEPFTPSDQKAEKKFTQIIEHTSWRREDGHFDGVWHALRDYVASGGKLTLMLGNHDVELSLPATRRLLMKVLGYGRIEFLYDNEAFVDGKVIVEHGNRYDGWNVVPHNSLRKIRSELSRKEPLTETPYIPGSYMVVNIINRLKKDFSFVDLLKPETSAVLPLLAVLDPQSLKYVPEVLYYLRAANSVAFTQRRKPKDDENISSTLIVNENKTVKKALSSIKKAQKLAGNPAFEGEGEGANENNINEKSANENIGAKENIKTTINFIKAVTTLNDKPKQINNLYQALRAFVVDQALHFDIGHELEEYLRAAVRLAKDFKVIVFGHTHFAKYIKLRELLMRDPLLKEHLNAHLDQLLPDAVYLNSGTWADLMKLPESLLKGDEAKAKAELEKFVDAIISNREEDLKNWRYMKPTFVKIDIDDEEHPQASLLQFNGSNREPTSLLQAKEK